MLSNRVAPAHATRVHMYQAYLTQAGAQRIGRLELTGAAVVFDEYTALGNARNIYYCGRFLAAYLSFVDSPRGPADLVKM